MSEHGKTPLLSRDEIAELGYAIALYPSSTLFAAAQSAREIATTLRRTARLGTRSTGVMAFGDLNELVGLDAGRPRRSGSRERDRLRRRDDTRSSSDRAPRRRPGSTCAVSASGGRCSSPTRTSSSSGSPSACESPIAELGIETEVYGRVRVEPSEESRPRRHRGGAGGRLRRLRRRRRRLVHRHREDRSALRHARRGAPRLRQPADRRGEAAAGPAAARRRRARPRRVPAARRPSVAIVDFPRLGVKTGISHRYLRPRVGIVDPPLTRDLPAAVTASAGSTSSATRRSRTRPARSTHASEDRRRTSDRRYQGSNPIADLWCAKALEIGGALSATRRRRRLRPRGAQRDDARGDDGGSRLRQRGLPHPARVRVPDRVAASTCGRRPAIRIRIRSCRTASR